jgi:hypothetical protein
MYWYQQLPKGMPYRLQAQFCKANQINRVGEVISRLYAVGCCASSVFGPGYPDAGSTVAAGAVFSWLAAKDAFTA